jgi:hypothetical protein
MNIQQEAQHKHDFQPIAGAVRWWRIAFVWVAGLFLVALGVQVFLAGMSIVFDATWWQVHMAMAFFIE